MLWDIDLTLLQVGPLGRELYAAAFQQVTGRPLRLPAQMGGRLDPVIFRDNVEAHDLDPAAHPFPRFAEALAAVYSSRSDDLREMGRVLPGAEAALTALSDLGAVQSVLTGNVKAVAIIKLSAFGLDRHLDVDIGAFGADGLVRASLVEVALRRARAKHGTPFDVRRTVLVGDTAHDVAAARGSGASVVAVASGRTPAAELLEAGADVVLPDLEDTAAVVRAVRNGRRV